jgi:hypothetical protein
MEAFGFLQFYKSTRRSTDLWQQFPRFGAGLPVNKGILKPIPPDISGYEPLSDPSWQPILLWSAGKSEDSMADSSYC